MSVTHAPAGLQVAAWAAIAAVVARTASIFLWPPDADAGHAKMLATAALHEGAWSAATAAEVVAWVTGGAAVLASTTLARGRGRWLTRVGGWWAGASLIVLGLVGGAMNAVTGIIAQQPHRQLMVGVQDDLSGSASPVLNAFVAVIMLGDLMLLVYAAGLVRAGLTPWWFMVLAVLADVGYIATGDSSNHFFVLVGFLPLAATWVVLARLLPVDRKAVGPQCSSPPRQPLGETVAEPSHR